MAIKIIIADDSDFVREGMSIILDVDEDFEVIGCAENGKKCVELARNHSADVILMDIQMPEMDGIEATKIITEENLGKVLILTTFDDYDLVQKAIYNGAKGYLIKNHTPDKLKQMIKSVHNGINVLDESVFEKMGTQSVRSDKFDASPFSTRELEIIEAVADGLSNKEIATKLFLSEGTVKNYISSILEKGEMEHRTQLAIYYLTGRK
ncbi:MAG: response regulator transcription factor [Lachnospiraceae bacterium]|nr:response regulator transcription factor [Lachnospiraceae bacterium]